MSSEPSPVSFENISIKYDYVPKYLHSSAFYKNLSAEGDHTVPIDVPRTCFKADDTVNSADDFKLLLHTMIFWGLDVIPDSVLNFCDRYNVNVWKSVTKNLPDGGILHSTLTSCYDSTKSISPAANSGRVEIVLHWIRKNRSKSRWNTQPCCDAAAAGCLLVLMELHAFEYLWNEETCAAAAQGGHLDCLMYLYEQECPWDERACTAAAEGGHLDCLRYLHDHGCLWYDDTICLAAAANGHLSCLQFAHERGGELDSRLTLIQDLDCLRYALQHDCPISEVICSGWYMDQLPLETIRLYQEHGIVWDEYICAASLRCPVDYTRYLFEHGCQCVQEVANEAVWEDKPQHLKYLMEEALLGMNAELFSEAVMNGHLACVQYLVDSGCNCNFVWHMELGNHMLMDEEVMLCIQYAADHGWVCSEDLQDFVFRNRLPLCQSYMRDEGIVESTRTYDISYRIPKKIKNKRDFVVECTSGVNEWPTAVYDGEPVQARNHNSLTAYVIAACSAVVLMAVLPIPSIYCLAVLAVPPIASYLSRA